MIKKFKNSNVSLSKKEKQHQIFRTALSLFSRYGYKKTTIEDVTSALGMTKSNLYFYVANKRDLYEQSVAHELTRWKDSVSQAVLETEDIKSKFTTMAVAAFQYLKDHHDFRRILIEDPTIFTLSSEEDRFSEINLKAKNLIKDILEQGVKQEVFIPIDLDHTTELLFSIYIMFLIKAYVKSEGTSSITMYEQGLKLILRGLSRQPKTGD